MVVCPCSNDSRIYRVCDIFELGLYSNFRRNYHKLFVPDGNIILVAKKLISFSEMQFRLGFSVPAHGYTNPSRV